MSRRNSFGRKDFPARRAAIAADIERGKEDGELHPDADPEVLVDTVFGASYYRLLFRSAPLNESLPNR